MTFTGAANEKQAGPDNQKGTSFSHGFNEYTSIYIHMRTNCINHC